MLSNKTKQTNPGILLMRCETHIVHFYHEMHFYGFEGQTKRFQTANPKHAELWVRALKKNKEKKKKKKGKKSQPVEHFLRTHF